MKNFERLLRVGVIPVIRASSRLDIFRLLRALKSGGIDTAEITMETPGTIEVIKKVAVEMGDEIMVGAGTVLDGETARMAIMAGAEFVVSPSLHPDVITVSNRYNKIVVPGAMTPTEIVNAFEHGADMVKVFPATVLGPEYIKALRGPYGHIPVMCTGGIDIHNAADFIKAGCAAIGVGGSLISRKDIEAGNWEAIIEKARMLVEAVKQGRQELTK